MTRWWAYSALDRCVHLLVSYGRPGGLTARCGHLTTQGLGKVDLSVMQVAVTGVGKVGQADTVVVPVIALT